MPLYRIESENSVSQIKSASFTTERKLQKLFEANLQELLGVRYIDSEYTTGDRQRGHRLPPGTGKRRRTPRLELFRSVYRSAMAPRCPDISSP